MAFEFQVISDQVSLHNLIYDTFFLENAMFIHVCTIKIAEIRGSPGGAVVKNPPANVGDMGLSPGPGRSHMLWSN